MKAFGFSKPLPISDANSIVEFETEKPTLRPHDILVEVKGTSMNPVDYKVRLYIPPESGNKIMGYDATGVVAEVGSEASLFKVGDEVWYSGDFTRSGTNSQFHAVDERVVGKKPKSLPFAEAAALPLTAITAWEILFDSFKLTEGGHEGESILIIGGAGGVGSIMTQLAAKLTKLNVIATASRPETIEFVKKMGAHHTINHHNNIVDELKTLGVSPKYIASLNGSDKNWERIIEAIEPRGHIAIIDADTELSVLPCKLKSLTVTYELMFTRPMMATKDIQKQHDLLNRVADLVDAGTIVTTATANLGPLTLENLKKGHELQETGKVIGKNVLGGFE